METLILADQLYRYYGPCCAVSGVSFTLQKGEILGFLGPNGAGKSTTMQMLCGNLAPTSGAIRINGIDLLESPKRAKTQLGYLPDQPPVYRELTVDEYLTYCARLHRLPRPRIAAAIDGAKERCGLGAVGRRLIGNLSKGYQQRLGIAQAILHQPAVIVLDEPTVGLDPIQIRQIRELIRELGRDHGIILSTHILSEVQESCTRVQIIHQGRLVLNDSIAGLTQRMRASSLHIATARPIPPGSLEQCVGIQSVEPLGDNRYRIYYHSHETPAEALAAWIVREGWGLRELTPEQRTLEEIFMEITAATRPPEAAPS